MHERADRGPKSELARYAYGYSDKKPGKSFWVIIGLMIVFIIWNMIEIG